MTDSDSVLATRVEETLTALGVAPGFLETRKLPLYTDAEGLALLEIDAAGRELFLTPPTVNAWQSMTERASHDGVELFVVSAFRSFDQQLGIIKRKLIAGQTWEEIFRVSAPPGCSEHHTGRAVDIGTPHCKVLDEEFEQTEAFEWLVRSGAEFGFRLSYPRGNSSGFAYEPWHWCFVEEFRSRKDEGLPAAGSP